MLREHTPLIWGMFFFCGIVQLACVNYHILGYILTKKENIGNKHLPQSVLQDKGIGIIESQKGDKDIKNVKIRKAVSSMKKFKKSLVEFTTLLVICSPLVAIADYMY